MIRKFWLFLVVFLLFAFHFPLSFIFAEGEFITESTVEYKVEKSGNTLVTHTITLENVFSNLYANSYSLILDGIEAKEIKAFDLTGNLNFKTEKNNDRTTINVTFQNPVVGKGKQRLFYITYNVNNFAQKTGEVWEITIPKLADDKFYRNYYVTFLVPDSFKDEAYISPEPTLSTSIEGYRSYSFSKEKVIKTGITAGFGEFQVFSFNLIYHLENPLTNTAIATIAIPPDTALQKVYYEVITPEPDDIKIDGDGNWLASYNLKSRERIDVITKGSVQIFSGPRQFQVPDENVLSKNLLSSDYWQTNDPYIMSLANSLVTPKKIYDYVSNHLKYNYDRVKPNVVRLGAKKALEEPKNAICTEFTDLFIAIARSAGIPAREINGFAYTENKDIQPLSLVADVLHSWPEYWDKDKGFWIPVDPTWASTTGGVDFFNKLDLRHFTFVIHGIDPVKPYPPGSYKLGINPQKDVFVGFGNLPNLRAAIISISSKSERFIPFFSQKIIVDIKNTGSSGYYNLPVNIYFDNSLHFSKTIDVLPPFKTEKINIQVPFSFFGKNNPNVVNVQAGSEKLEIPTAKKQVIIYNLLTLFLLIIIFVLIILVKFKKLNLRKIILTRAPET